MALLYNSPNDIYWNTNFCIHPIGDGQNFSLHRQPHRMTSDLDIVLKKVQNH